MDLVKWDKEAFDRIAAEMESLAARLGVSSVTLIPVSALLGDNVVERSHAASWYDGPSVREALEDAPVGSWASTSDQSAQSASRLPVQWVLRRPGGGRSYAGMVNGAPLRVGDTVAVLPEGKKSTITNIAGLRGPLEVATVGLSVSVDLADDLDVSRGDLLATFDAAPEVVTRFDATVCWFAETPLEPGTRLRVKHTTRVTPARVLSIRDRLDVNHLRFDSASQLVSNDIGVVEIETATPLAVDPYSNDRITGSFVLIDEATYATVAACMVGWPALGEAPEGHEHP
jgi:bifunctional enzyme CysN/CysC